MYKTAIIYCSLHHKNTEKLVKAIKSKYNITLIDASVHNSADLSVYELIGFASGIAFGKFYSPVEKFLAENLPENKKIFFMYTCANNNSKFTDSIRKLATDKNAVVVGQYSCKGFNTYGPLKFIGGMNKNYPDNTDIESAVEFFESISL